MAGWVTAVAPSAAEQEELVTRHGVPRAMIEHALDPAELPRVHRSGEVMLVVLRVPVRDERPGEAPWQTVPLGLVLCRESVVTICARENDVIERLRRHGEGDVDKRDRFVLHALEATAETFVKYVREIDAAVDRLEDQLDQSLENREVRELLRCQKSLAYFTAALSGMALVLETLQASPDFVIPEQDQGLLRDTLVEVRQAQQMTELSAGILSQMMDAFASMISNNLNVVMKFLAAMTLVLTLPMLVASFWGMNVPVPGNRSPLALGLLVGGSLAASAVAALLLWRRRWL